jgi:low temperature requirement protein LtrA
VPCEPRTRPGRGAGCGRFSRRGASSPGAAGASLGFTILTFGGPALFLLAQVSFFAGAFGHVPRSRLVGLVAHALLAVATAPLTLIVGIGAWTAVLVAIAIADTIQAGDRAPSS